jgi:hypothetical protein
MRWGKFVLLFQAVATLIIGMVFFTQVVALDAARISELKVQVSEGNAAEGVSPEYIDIKQRYSAASYILLFVSLMELIIITKLFI